MNLRTIYGQELAPRSIYCIGRNYAEHARELGNAVPAEPLVFLKSLAALRCLEPAPMPYPDETFHHEVEIVAILTQDRPLGSRDGWGGIGYLALGLDLTRREVQANLKAQGHPWTAAKSFSGSAVVAPAIPVGDFTHKDHLEFSLSVNGQMRQQGATPNMLVAIPDLVNFLCQSHALMSGDLIYTGTPAGVGPIRRGDHFKMEFRSPEISFSGVL